jgi:hypothetical protein
MGAFLDNTKHAYMMMIVITGGRERKKKDKFWSNKEN